MVTKEDIQNEDPPQDDHEKVTTTAIGTLLQQSYEKLEDDLVNLDYQIVCDHCAVSLQIWSEEDRLQLQPNHKKL